MTKKVYVGPKIEGLRPYTIFDGDLPKSVADLIEKQPKLKRLMVAPEKVQETKVRVKTAGDPLNKIFKEISRS